MSSDLPNMLIAGNWKMNGLRSSLEEIEKIGAGLDDDQSVGALICPPATLLEGAVRRAGSTPLKIGAQDVHWERHGAFTGDISADMVADAGGRYVIVGHSERRDGHGETDETVRRKASSVQQADLTAIVCVGESETDRRAGRAVPTIQRQLEGSIRELKASALAIAYEPIWAIGTGLTPSLEDIAEVHSAIREALAGTVTGQGETVRILYGGSVKPNNAGEILQIDGVDGALVGGASLKAEDFLSIVAAARGVA